MSMELLPPSLRRSPRRAVIVAIFALVLIWSSLLFRPNNDDAWDLSKSLNLFGSSIHGKPVHELSQAEWVQAALNTEIDEPADITPVVDLCKKTAWREGLVFQCTRVRGGIGNVKNIVLTCLRYAIEAGATGLIIPAIDTRSETELIETAIGIEDFEYLLDTSHFLASVQRTCPQIQIYDSLHDFEAQHPEHSSTITRGKGVGGEIYKSFTYSAPELWRSSFETWLRGNVTHEPSSSRPILVSIDWAMFEWPISYESVDFVKAFGQIVRNQRDATEVSALVLYGLAKVIANSSGVEFDPRKGIQPGTYYGAHLRTDSDAAMQGWQDYDTQSSHYLQHASRLNLSTLYITSGTIEHVEKFAKTASEEHNITVVYKDLLLSDPDLARLNALSWDQRGIVDYEVLLKASALGGIDMSSFSLNLAMRRHGLVISEGDERGWVELSGEKERLTIADGLSEILHDPRDYFNIWLGMWP